MVLTEKTDANYNPKVRNIFAFLTLDGYQRVIGSASLKEMKYTADFDLMENVELANEHECYQLVLDLFREKMNTAYKSNDIWITDFKCGVLAGGIPIRWNRDEIKKGCKNIDEKIINFIDCLQQESTIKIDVISLINNELNEFSENYYIQFGDFKTYNPINSLKTNIETSLLKDMIKYKNKGNIFKALKRLFAYLRISKKSPSLIKLLLNFFNSSVGKLGSSRSDLEIIELAIKQKFRPIPISILKTNLKLIEKDIGDEYEGLVKLIINAKTKPSMLKHTERAIEILNEQLQLQTQDFIKINNNKIKQYI